MKKLLIALGVAGLLASAASVPAEAHKRHFKHHHHALHWRHHYVPYAYAPVYNPYYSDPYPYYQPNPVISFGFGLGGGGWGGGHHHWRHW